MCQECYIEVDKTLAGKKQIPCHRCNGTGIYSWGANVNGKQQHSGSCFACDGKGQQTKTDLNREYTYYSHRMKIYL